MSSISRYERAEHTPWWSRSSALIIFNAAGYLVIGATVMFYVLPRGFELGGVELVLLQSAVALLGAAVIAYVAWMIRRGIRHRASLWALSAALGWQYTSDVSDRLWGGSIDEQIDRRSRLTMDHIDATHTASPFDAARRTFAVGSGQGATVHTTLAVRLPLPAETPRMQLRSRNGNGPLSVLPHAPSGRQELRLEGDFSDVFAVSVPVGYERDALYVLTPDLLVILLDNAADLDLEIVDSTLHVYFPPLDLTDHEVLTRFHTVISALFDRFGRRTIRYRDAAAPAIDAETYRRSGDTLSHAARTIDTRARLGPVASAVLAPLVPLLIGVVWMQLAA
jgi:hypothetical protein